jgi:hypothetical protein
MICPISGINRTKMFHVKHFCTIDGNNTSASLRLSFERNLLSGLDALRLSFERNLLSGLDIELPQRFGAAMAAHVERVFRVISGPDI